MNELAAPPTLEEALTETARLVEGVLDQVLPRPEGPEARLYEAMRYATLGGGKRLRPHLARLAATLFGGPDRRSLRAGAAIELVHAYSLVHDDLPAMDDDALRRGRPTCHIAFGEATAILAGDALLTLAFDVMARAEVHRDPAVRAALVLELARAAGIGGMAGGQMLDLAAEGRFATKRALATEEIEMLQAMKTGALLRFACRAGAIVGKADAASLASLDRYGRAIGQAFQIADDLLDLESDAATLGKAAGKDAVAGKATLVAALGAAGAHARLDALVVEAEDALAPFAAKAGILRAAARFVAERRK